MSARTGAELAAEPRASLAPAHVALDLRPLLSKKAGTLDRLVRITLGIALLSLTIVGPRSALGYVGLVPLLTGVIGFCPLYRLFGLNTCPVPRP